VLYFPTEDMQRYSGCRRFILITVNAVMDDYSVFAGTLVQAGTAENGVNQYRLVNAFQGVPERRVIIVFHGAD